MSNNELPTWRLVVMWAATLVGVYFPVMRNDEEI